MRRSGNRRFCWTLFLHPFRFAVSSNHLNLVLRIPYIYIKLSIISPCLSWNERSPSFLPAHGSYGSCFFMRIARSVTDRMSDVNPYRSHALNLYYLSTSVFEHSLKKLFFSLLDYFQNNNLTYLYNNKTLTLIKSFYLKIVLRNIILCRWFIVRVLWLL